MSMSNHLLRYEIRGQHSTAKDLDVSGQRYPLLIGEVKPPSFESPFAYTVLFYNGIDNRLLVSVEPPGQGHYEEAEGLYDVTHCPIRSSVILSENNIIQLVRIFAPYGIRRIQPHQTEHCILTCDCIWQGPAATWIFSDGERLVVPQH